MPFTFAHPAAAIPLARLMGRNGVVSALALGSMMPDLPFFLGVRLAREYTHAPVTLLTWSLPAGLLMFALFHAMLRPALTELAPGALGSRLPSAFLNLRSWRTWTATGISIVAGAATHLFWDAFTHPGTAFVHALPALQIKLATFGSYDLYVMKVLQHASSAIGLSLLAWWAVRWWMRSTPRAVTPPALPPVMMWSAWTALTLLPLTGGVIAAAHALHAPARLAAFIFTTLPLFFWALVAFSLMRFVQRKRQS